MENLYLKIKQHQQGKFFLIAGPCVIENEANDAHNIALKIKDICNHLGILFIFKASYKKANRTSLYSFSGIGDKKALRIIADIGKDLGVPTTTDIHESKDADMVAEYVDILQIPAFLCRQTDLLLAAAQTGKIVNVKKGQFLSGMSMKFVVEKINHTQNHQLLLTERGNMFGYQDLIVDYRNIPDMQSFGVPVVMDCTHSLQCPNHRDGLTGGHPQMISTIARAAVAIGVNGLFIETHPKPEQAKSDGKNMLNLDLLNSMLEQLVRIGQSIQTK